MGVPSRNNFKKTDMKTKTIRGVTFNVEVSRSDFDTSTVTMDGGPDHFCMIKCIGPPKMYTYRALLREVHKLIDKTPI